MVGCDRRIAYEEPGCSPCGHAGVGTLLVVGSFALAEEKAPTRSWQAGNTAEAAGIKVTFSKPVLVGRSKGYLWFPTLVRLSSGELVAMLSDYADVNVAESTSMVSWSWDGGLSWGPLAKALGSDGSLTLPNGDTLFMPYYLRPMGDGVMGAPYQLCPKGSRKLKVIKPGITIEGWPRSDKSLDPRLGLSGFVCNGQVVPLKEKGYLATLYGHFRDTNRYSLVASESLDGVRWKIRSVVADEKCELSGREGPCESAMCRLKDGRLLLRLSPRFGSTVRPVFQYGRGSDMDEAHGDERGLLRRAEPGSNAGRFSRAFGRAPGSVLVAEP